MNTVVLLSGGLDSTTLLYDLMAKGQVCRTLFFDYGQPNARRENEAIKHIRNDWLSTFSLDVRLKEQKGTWITHSTQGIEPAAFGDLSKMGMMEGLNEGEVLRNNEVPNRNMVLLSMAAAYAITTGCDLIAIATHKGATGHYFPDTSPGFIRNLETLLRVTTSFRVNGIEAPYQFERREFIWKRAHELGVPVGKTWSCYRDGIEPCGKCGACLDRQEGEEALYR